LAANKNLVMVGSNDGNFWGFDITTGEKRFSRRLLDAMKSTAAAFGDDVFFTSWDQRLVALHMTNGHQRWAVSLSAPSQTSPTIVPPLNLVIAADQSGRCVGVDISTGAIRWEQKFAADRFLASGLVTKEKSETIFWSSCDRRTLCAVHPNNGRVLQRIPLRANLTGVPVAFRGRLYVALDGAEGGLSAFGSDPP
jgi:hypothetical protein